MASINAFSAGVGGSEEKEVGGNAVERKLSFPTDDDFFFFKDRSSLTSGLPRKDEIG